MCQHNSGVTGTHIIAVQTVQEKSQRCQNPLNVMTYAPAAKTDKPTDWIALWISFGDGACSKKNNSHGYDLYFNKSCWRGECGLSNDGRCLRFPIFCMGCCGEDDWVVNVAEIPVPKVIDKLFFEKVVQLIQFSCDCNPEYSVEAFDWDWAGFHKNILLPNRMHIQPVMQLSDNITDQVVYSVHVMLNDWNGNDDEENDDEVVISFEKFFSVEDLDF